MHWRSCLTRNGHSWTCSPGGSVSLWPFMVFCYQNIFTINLIYVAWSSLQACDLEFGKLNMKPPPPSNHVEILLALCLWISLLFRCILDWICYHTAPSSALVVVKSTIQPFFRVLFSGWRCTRKMSVCDTNRAMTSKDILLTLFRGQPWPKMGTPQHKSMHGIPTTLTKLFEQEF